MKLNVSTGLQEYNINEKCTVYFNPTDPSFIEKVFNAFDMLDERHEAYRNQLKEETDGRTLFRIAKEMDAEMRGIIDGVFDTEVCNPVFGNVSVYASSDGLPLWANLLLAIMDELDDAFAKEKKKTNPRLVKYTQKYTLR